MCLDKMSKNKNLTLTLPEEKKEVIISEEKSLPLVEKPKKKDKIDYSSEDIRDIALRCIKAMFLMIEPKNISKKFNVIYCPYNAGIDRKSVV